MTGRRPGLLLLAGAAAAALAAAWLAAEPALLARDGQRIEGRVVATAQDSLGPLPRPRPIIAFRAEGREHRILGQGLVARPPGTRVDVLRDRASGRAIVPGLAEAWAPAAALGGLSLLLGIAGALLWLRRAPAPRIRLSEQEVRVRAARGESVTDIRRAVRRDRR